MSVSSQKPFPWLKNQAKPARKWLLLSIFLDLLNGLLILGQAFFITHIIVSAFASNFTIDYVNFVWLSLIFLIRALLAWGREPVRHQAKSVVLTQMRASVLTHLLNLGPIRSKDTPTGKLVSQVIEQVDAMAGFFSNYLPQMTLVGLLPLVILIVVGLQNWLSAVILLVTAPLIPLFMALVGMGAESINQKQLQTMARMSAHFLDTLQGLTTLKLFNRTAARRNHIAEVSKAFRLRTLRVLKIAFMSSAVLELFATLSIALIAVYLGLSLLGKIHFGDNSHLMTLSTALFILILIPEFYQPLRDLGTYYHDKAAAVGAAKELMTLFDEPTVQLGDIRALPDAKHVSVKVLDLNFHYHNQQSVLNNFNLQMAPGEHVALVGPSGSGKSTLLHLLAGFLQPPADHIWINGIDLTTLDLSYWRTCCAWVGQGTQLLPGTIRENLQMAKPQASDDELIEAMSQADLSALLLSLPQGLDTIIHEKNAGLSGGQAQRLSLCRALLSDRPLILFDEPTAHLDAQSTAKIRKTMKKLLVNKTALIATHDLELMAWCDRMVRTKP